MFYTPLLDVRRLRRGLVAYWPLSEANGATRKPSLWVPGSTPGTHFDLTDHATVTQGTGPSANIPLCATLAAASSQWLDVADSHYVSMPNTDMTLTAWVKLTSTPANIMGIAGQFNNASRGYYIRYNNGTDALEWVVNSSATLTKSLKTTPGTTSWYFLVGTFEQRTGFVNGSINGAALGTPTAGTAGTGIVDSTSVFIIGNEEAGSRFFDGSIAGVGLWRRVLSDGEIFALYNNGQGLDLGRGV